MYSLSNLYTLCNVPKHHNLVLITTLQQFLASKREPQIFKKAAMNESIYYVQQLK